MSAKWKMESLLQIAHFSAAAASKHSKMLVHKVDRRQFLLERESCFIEQPWELIHLCWRRGIEYNFNFRMNAFVIIMVPIKIRCNFPNETAHLPLGNVLRTSIHMSNLYSINLASVIR